MLWPNRREKFFFSSQTILLSECPIYRKNIKTRGTTAASGIEK